MKKLKHLLIEGPDRTGKDTLIKNLMPHCQNLIITHFSFPQGNSDSEKRSYQEESFKSEFAKSCWFLETDMFKPASGAKMNLLVWNRAHLGEFVYGNLYRQTNPEEWVMALEEAYGYHRFEEVYLLLFTADPEFLASQDDGKSFSGTTESRRKEMENFRNAFNLSQIKKKLEIQVDYIYAPKLEDFKGSDQDLIPRRCYRSSQEILDQVLKFLNS